MSDYEPKIYPVPQEITDKMPEGLPPGSLSALLRCRHLISYLWLIADEFGFGDENSKIYQAFQEHLNDKHRPAILNGSLKQS